MPMTVAGPAILSKARPGRLVPATNQVEKGEEHATFPACQPRVTWAETARHPPASLVQTSV